MALRGANRLGIILRKFGIPAGDVAKQEPQVLKSALKVEFMKQAKESHPDLASEADKEEAQQKFIRLRQDYEEAVKLLESGVRPSWSQQAGSTHRQQGGDPFAQAGSVHYTSEQHGAAGRPWNEYQEPPRQEQEFDFATRMKGRLILATGSIFFFFGMREFLAYSAGGTMKWHPGSGVRRYAEVGPVSDSPIPVPIKTDVKVQRKVDSFYAKRGVKDKTTEYRPRGFGKSGSKKVQSVGANQIS